MTDEPLFAQFWERDGSTFVRECLTNSVFLGDRWHFIDVLCHAQSYGKCPITVIITVDVTVDEIHWIHPKAIIKQFLASKGFNDMDVLFKRNLIGLPERFPNAISEVYRKRYLNEDVIEGKYRGYIEPSDDIGICGDEKTTMGTFRGQLELTMSGRTYCVGLTTYSVVRRGLQGVKDDDYQRPSGLCLGESIYLVSDIFGLVHVASCQLGKTRRDSVVPEILIAYAKSHLATE